MSDESDEPELRVPLGLKPSLRPTYDSLLRRSRRRLQLLHSGQNKLEYLTDEQYLRGARLIVVEDEYVLVAPILEPPQGDLIGYPGPDGPPSRGAIGGRAANDSDGARDVDARARREPVSARGDSTSADAAAVASMDLGAALDALLGEDMLADVSDPGPTADREQGRGHDRCAPCETKFGEKSPRASPGPGDADASGIPSSGDPRLAPTDANRLKVDQALTCVEASSSMLTQVAEVSQTSSNLVEDIRALERATGLKSGPSRSFIAAREPEFVVEVDGHRVPFAAPVVRPEMAGTDEVSIWGQFAQTRAENDVMPFDVLEAKGIGVPGGVSTLGRHDVRYVRLVDWQRAVLLILRGAGTPVSLGVQEGISTARLERKPALVVNPGDWLDLKRIAMELLAGAEVPKASKNVEPDPSDVATRQDDDQEAA